MISRSLSWTAAMAAFCAFTATAWADGHEVKCPDDIKGNECAYFQDGYMAGSEDGKASMSMAYERHAESYDSRFEPYFAKGYEEGWKKNR